MADAVTAADRAVQLRIARNAAMLHHNNAAKLRLSEVQGTFRRA
jgi:tRNA-binding EMAP/Myf-like protein